MADRESIIKDLFNGDVMIGEMLQPKGDEADYHRRVQLEMSEKLKYNLTEEQFSLHEDYMAAVGDTYGDEVYKAYLQGIYLGLRLMAESFYHSEL